MAACTETAPGATRLYKALKSEIAVDVPSNILTLYRNLNFSEVKI